MATVKPRRPPVGHGLGIWEGGRWHVGIRPRNLSIEGRAARARGALAQRHAGPAVQPGDAHAILWHVKDRVRERYTAQVEGLRALAALVTIMWAVELVNALDSYRLDRDGIVPRSLPHLYGIALAPFLHASFSHLLGNTVPFVILGFA